MFSPLNKKSKENFTSGYFLNLIDNYQHINLLSCSNICFKLVLQDITPVIDILLVKKNKEIKNVLNKLSHEIKTSCISINTILSSVNQKIVDKNIKDQTSYTNSFMKKLEKISFFSEYMINTIHQINNYVDDFKNENAKFPIVVNIKQELGWAYLFTKSLLFNQNKFNIKVKLLIDDDAPEFITTERDKFRILICEVIKNSVKHIFFGEIKIMLSCTKPNMKKSSLNVINQSVDYDDMNDKTISITISDTGTGIKEKVLKSIKEYLEDDIFFHNSVFAVTGSLRLGFSTMKHYADDIGAMINIFSKDGKGTICDIILNKSNIAYGRSNSMGGRKNKSTKSLMFSMKMNNQQTSTGVLLKGDFRGGVNSNKYISSTKAKTSSINFISSIDTTASYLLDKKSSLNIIAESIISPPSTAINNGGYYNTFSSTLLFNLNLNKINDEDYCQDMDELITTRVNNRISQFDIKKKEDLINIKESDANLVQYYDNKESDEEEEAENEERNTNLNQAYSSETQKQISEEFNLGNKTSIDNIENESLKILNFKFDEEETNKYSFQEPKMNPLLPLKITSNAYKRNSADLNLESVALNILKISPLIKRKQVESAYIVGVDDDFSCRKSMENLFKKIIKENDLDLNVIILNDGIELIEFIIRSIKENLCIKLIVTDENMEYVNGSNSLCLLNSLYSFVNKDIDLPSTFILTAMEGNDISQELKKKSNCIQVITKPINRSYMLECFYKAKILNKLNI